MFHSAQQSTRGAGGSVVGQTAVVVKADGDKDERNSDGKKSSLLNRRLMLGSNQKMEMTQLGVYVDITWIYLPTHTKCLQCRSYHSLVLVLQLESCHSRQDFDQCGHVL